MPDPVPYELDTAALYLALDGARSHRRVSWRDIAAEMGVSASTLTRLQAGKSPSAAGLLSILGWLHMPAERFTIQVMPRTVINVAVAPRTP